MDKEFKIQLNCFNCRGLRNRDKRINIFHWIKANHNGITFLQETHSSVQDEARWEREWQGEIYFSHGEFNARGVAILIPKDLINRFKMISGEKDKNGRFLLLKCKFEDEELILVNIYSPTKDNQKGQLIFLENIRGKLEDYGEYNLILGGDFNTYLNVKLDKKGGIKETQSNYSEKIIELCEEYTLTDIWRIRNQDKLMYTRREKCKSGVVQSRLDYWLISRSLAYQITKTDIKPGILSDHSLITINIGFGKNVERGKGYWKFNNDLLLDKDYIEMTKNTIEHIKANVRITDKNVLWEYTKCQIRTDTISYSIKRARRLKEKENELRNRLEKLEANLNGEEVNYLEYIECKLEWENIIRRKVNGILTRSKTKWLEEGEKNTKYFLNLEKRNYNNCYIKTLIAENGQEISKPIDILEEEKKYYTDLYSTKLKNSELELENIKTFLEKEDIPKLSENEKDICEEELSLSECAKALSLLPNNKSPGSDGFTTNFYKFFWSDLKDILFESYKYSFQTGNLSQNQKRGILNLLPKEKKDLRFLKNWRPVSLLNTDYKILTKALAIRLQKVIPTLINSDQVGYIKGRYIGENIRVIFDLMRFAEQEQCDAFIAQIDFEKAFDSIEWPFLLQVLKSYNFGDNFQKWTKILYTDISSCVGNNGTYSSYFKLSRAIRQGCPISALFFLLVAEIVAINIRNDKKIKGLKINDSTEFKINLMADDTTLFLSGLNSLSFAIYTFKEFQKYSGLKINISKTEIIPIGKNSGKNIVLAPEFSEIKVRHGPFKALGIWFANKQESVIELNFTERIKKMNTMLNIWSQRNLSLKGKITILKTLILPQIYHLFNTIYIPNDLLKKIDKLFLNFLWNNKTHKIKRETIIAPINQGGLAMVDIFVANRAAKVNWIKRLLDTRTCKWKELFWKMLTIPKHILFRNLNIEDIIGEISLTQFHTQILETWLSVATFKPETMQEILSQYISYNQHIKVRKQIIKEFIGNNNIKYTRIVDIVDKSTGNFKSLNEINTSLNLNLKQLNLNSIVSAIPTPWKRLIKSRKLHSTDYTHITTNEPYIKIGNNLKHLSKVTTKELYNKIVGLTIKAPTALEKWIDMYPFLESYNWDSIFLIPFRIMTEPYFQSFQYKILNRILNCKDNLYNWKIKENNKCNYCKEIDTIEHHLVSCPESKIIWDKLEKWIYTNINIKFNLTECEIIFGLPFCKESDIDLMNFLLIITKWYINSVKSNDKPLYFLELLQIIGNKIMLISYANKINNRINKSWQDQLYDIFN